MSVAEEEEASPPADATAVLVDVAAPPPSAVPPEDVAEEDAHVPAPGVPPPQTPPQCEAIAHGDLRYRGVPRFLLVTNRPTFALLPHCLLYLPPTSSRDIMPLFQLGPVSQVLYNMVNDRDTNHLISWTSCPQTNMPSFTVWLPECVPPSPSLTAPSTNPPSNRTHTTDDTPVQETGPGAVSQGLQAQEFFQVGKKHRTRPAPLSILLCRNTIKKRMKKQKINEVR